MAKDFEDKAEKFYREDRKPVTLLFDGRQFFAKIPTEYSRALKLEKGMKMDCFLEMPKVKGEKAILKMVLEREVKNGGAKKRV
ncbi:MAG: hypothetical protein WA139_02500 [Candidatus Aenigmatarchaeota archaeon]